MKKLNLGCFLGLVLVVMVSSASWGEEICPQSPFTKGILLLENKAKPYWTNCWGEAVYDRLQGHYVGQWKDNKPHGFGTITSGAAYLQGMWHNGRFREHKLESVWKKEQRTTPSSTASSSSLSACTSSSWRQNCFDTVTFSSGNKYVGEWKNNKRHGQGTVTFANGNKYVGEWKNGNAHGQATFIFASGNKYVGEYKNNKRHGQGTVTFANGNKYVGEWKDDKLHGQGSYTFASGRVQEGIWENGTFQYAQKGTSTVTASSSSAGAVYCYDKITNYAYVRVKEPLLCYTYDKEITLAEYNRRKREGYDGGIVTEDEKEKAELRREKEKVAAERQELEEEKRKFVEEKRERDRLAAQLEEQKTYPAASGTGFFVNDKGYIVTNYHVIKGCKNVHMHQRGDSLLAAVIAKDNVNDLALLRVSANSSSYYRLSNREPTLMEEVYVAGFPFGKNYNSSVRITKGIISSLSGVRDNYANIQIDAALQPGNSGGPIFNEKGNVIGVALAKLSPKEVMKKWGAIPENTNFGIKSNIVISFLRANGLELKQPNTNNLLNRQLGDLAEKSTLYLSCWMTKAQIAKMRSSNKVLFSEYISE